MVYKLLVIAGVVAGIAGCATTPLPVQEPDNTPTHPTAVIETHVINEGIKGFFPYESTDRNYCRSNMNREDSVLKGTGTFTGFLIGTNNKALITRLDRNLVWTLNPDKHEYTECPVTGCRAPSKPVQAEQKSEQPRQQHEPDCTMKIAKTSFTVKPTGQKQKINGFDTDEYKVAWLVTLQDNTARKTTSTLNVDVWTTPVTPALQQALDMEAAYARGYLGKIAPSASDKILPAEVGKMIMGYLSSAMSPADRSAFLAVGREMGKIKGHPISTRIDWNMQGNACEPKEAASGNRAPTSASGVVSGITDMFTKKKTEEAESRPILSFVVEVKSLKVEPVHDSMFAVPKGYKLVNQK
jgi:hypothetical protein